jgi:hypothetical protein
MSRSTASRISSRTQTLMFFPDRSLPLGLRGRPRFFAAMRGIVMTPGDGSTPFTKESYHRRTRKSVVLRTLRFIGIFVLTQDCVSSILLS